MEIYLDHAATTKPCKESVAAINSALTEIWGNPSAVHQMGLTAEKAVKHARNQVADALGCDPGQVYFTSGGTEGDNFAIFSVAEKYQKRGKHIITTAYEHSAVLSSVRHLEERGFEVTYLTPEADGTIGKRQLMQALRKDTILVSIMMVNNEVGAKNDIAALSKLTHQKSEAIFHTDAVQSFLKVPFRASSLGADIITVSGHKIQGPKGIGAMYVGKNVHLPPCQYGGGQEKGLRSGTENVPMILGFGAACEAAMKNLPEKLRNMEALKQRLLAGLSTMEDVVVNGTPMAPHVVSLGVPGVRSQGLIGCLQEEHIYVSAGSACSRGHRSHVLEAMNIPPEVIDGSIRVSFCYDTTEDEVDAFLSALARAIKRLK